ncbi:MAG: winged helix-turn-helix transcriptional regulator [Halodesulfurarchaeum sp.]
MTPPSRLDDLPPSAKLVYTVLEHDGPLTQKELVEESMLSARTVRYALERLDECGCIDEPVYLEDTRQSLYRVPAPGDEATGEPRPEAA